MGVVSGCCKEVYRFPHNTTYPYSTCISSFFAAASLLFFHLKNVFSFFVYTKAWSARYGELLSIYPGLTISVR